MNRSTISATLSAALVLAGCATAPTDGRPAGDTCQAAPGQTFIGRKADVATGAGLLAVTSSREIRWVAPGMMVTADYKFGRLTVGYDEAMIIRNVACS